MKKLLLLLLIVVLAGCGGREGYRMVKRVIDGDTFVLENGEKVRLIGIDAPESRNTGRKKIGFFGKESKAFLKQYLTGRQVRLEYDVTRTDMYGRTLAYVYMEDGTFLNAELVKQGYANVYTYPPNVKYADLFVDMQRDARENERGLWANGHQPDVIHEPFKVKSQRAKAKRSKKHRKAEVEF